MTVALFKEGSNPVMAPAHCHELEADPVPTAAKLAIIYGPTRVSRANAACSVDSSGDGFEAKCSAIEKDDTFERSLERS